MRENDACGEKMLRSNNILNIFSPHASSAAPILGCSQKRKEGSDRLWSKSYEVWVATPKFETIFFLHKTGTSTKHAILPSPTLFSIVHFSLFIMHNNTCKQKQFRVGFASSCILLTILTSFTVSTMARYEVFRGWLQKVGAINL